MCKDFGELRDLFTVVVWPGGSGLPVELSWNGENDMFEGLDRVDGIKYKIKGSVME